MFQLQKMTAVLSKKRALTKFMSTPQSNRAASPSKARYFELGMIAKAVQDDDSVLALEMVSLFSNRVKTLGQKAEEIAPAIGLVRNWSAVNNTAFTDPFTGVVHRKRDLSDFNLEKFYEAHEIWSHISEPNIETTKQMLSVTRAISKTQPAEAFYATIEILEKSQPDDPIRPHASDLNRRIAGSWSMSAQRFEGLIQQQLSAFKQSDLSPKAE